MENEADRSGSIRLFCFAARLEIIIWLLVSTSNATAFLGIALDPFGDGFRGPALSIFMLWVVGFLLSLILLGAVFEQFYRFRTPKSTKPSIEAKKIISEQTGFNSSFRLPPNRWRVVLNDLSVAAHVKSVLRPKIVVSGALLVGLARSNRASRAMIAHERAHISLGDKYVPGAIVVVMIALFANFYAFFVEINEPWISRAENLEERAFLLALNTVVIFLLARSVFLRREIYADAIGNAILGCDGSMGELLSTMDDEKSMWHPSKMDRLRAVVRSGWIHYFSPLWFCYWIVIIGMGAVPFFQAWSAQVLSHPVFGPYTFESDANQFNRGYWIGSMVLGFTGLACEIAKSAARIR